RLAREVFALLPIEVTIVTVGVEAEEGEAQKPVVSVILPRDNFLRLDFDNVDPSDAVEQFRVRSSLKISRRTGVFQEVQPWTFGDLDQPPLCGSLLETRQAVVNMRQQIMIEAEQLFE